MTRKDFPLIFELTRPGRIAVAVPDADVPEVPLEAILAPALVRRDVAELPEVSEPDLVRHYTRLSQRNYAVDVGFYPLGSCTMKYNPKVNEDAARLPGFARLHPNVPDELAQGALRLLWDLEQILCEISGMDRVTFQPAAGAHGELTALMMIRAYHEDRGERRTRVIVPDSAHGTNPASAAMCGYTVVTVPSDRRGNIDVEALRRAADATVAAVMLTNPNTLGLFEERIVEVAQIVHGCGALLYLDGANFNAVLGVTRPGDQGFDVMHMNVHKTFSTPHGGGGPGAGPVAVKRFLEPYLPAPTVERTGDRFRLDHARPKSIGRVRAFHGNFGVLVRAYAYLRTYGPLLRQVSEAAVINANYLLARLRAYFDVPYDRPCMHEFVLSGRRQKAQHGVRTLDIAKRLLDHGYHAPTIYFPLIVDEAIMIEPTETESRQTLDAFAEAMIEVADECARDPETVRTAPHQTVVSRLDEVTAARQPNLRWRPPVRAASLR
ncbi:MAG: aminomethyl-transferring glycine dehydrogenase subunit GcvPB [Armatimonadota bacterium]|nr:aminomethyl-transferring glycine dehydrogenase subunit GcvPB [Armatimonadota bacterium]MDR7531936.1 aminomethyl-transferring glycine dehydrogenase subunit GcvPB [Armatimonadota bacterium]